jgi:hypothetical protein
MRVRASQLFVQYTDFHQIRYERHDTGSYANRVYFAQTCAVELQMTGS